MVINTVEYLTSEGVHTNEMESLWFQLKIKLKRIREMQRSMIPSYIDEFMWRKVRAK